MGRFLKTHGKSKKGPHCRTEVGCGGVISVHSEPDGLEGRPAILQLVTITKQSVDQSKTQVQCKLCGKGMAGTTERMAAHFEAGTEGVLEPAGI